MNSAKTLKMTTKKTIAAKKSDLNPKKLAGRFSTVHNSHIDEKETPSARAEETTPLTGKPTAASKCDISTLHPSFRLLVTRVSNRETTFHPQNIHVLCAEQKKDKDYTKYSFELTYGKPSPKMCMFVVGNVTPTYDGALVTMYDRDANNKITHYNQHTGPEAIFIWYENSVFEKSCGFGQTDNRQRKCGFWLVSRKVLLQRGFFAQVQCGQNDVVEKTGKSAMRFWPPWTSAATLKTKSARDNQLWQNNCFVDLRQDDAAIWKKCMGLLTG
eukprot:GEMP01089541.1.p1 GENE.GEMP01089541.1~~GEMP01089541.1.p1  ORF type:complete len:271 (+),score=43.89 GEMP01089541.1:43-855(+)